MNATYIWSHIHEYNSYNMIVYYPNYVYTYYLTCVDQMISDDAINLGTTVCS